MNKQAIRKPSIIVLAIAGAIILALVVLVVLFWGPVIELFTDPNRAREFVSQAGPLSPLVFMLLQVLQVVVAPIPGQITGVVGGLLFGVFWGTLYGMIGTTLGFILVFILARKLGRPFVEYFFDPKLIKKFDYISQKNGALILFLIFLLPAFPDDLICYVAGLTTIKIRTLVVISVLGRLPTYFLLSLTGSGVAESNSLLVTILAGVMAVIALIGFWQRNRIQAWVKSLSGSRDDNVKD